MSKLFKFNHSSFKKGFTLIELLVVVSIIGMLSSIILVSVQSARSKAKDIKLITEMKELQKALELYRLDNNGYPTDNNFFHATAATCLPAATGGKLITDNGFFDQSFKTKYMSTLPTELVSCGIYYLGMDGTGNPTVLSCDIGSGTNIEPDGKNAAGNDVNEKYAYVFVVGLINSYSPSPNLPKASWGGNVTNSYCFLGPKR